MRTPEHDEGRSLKARALAVESLEGRRLPSGLGPVPVGPGVPSAGFVYRVEGFGGPGGPALAPPPRFTAVAMPAHFGAARMPMGDFFVAGDEFRAPGPPERAAFLKMAQFDDARDNMVRFDSRAGGGDGPVQLRYNAVPVFMSPGLRVDAMFAVAGAVRARAAVDENPAVVVFARPQRATTSAADAPPLTETPSTPAPAALPIAAAPEPVVVQPPRVAPAVVAGIARGAAAPVEVPDRRALAVADRALMATAAFQPSASADTTPGTAPVLPAGETARVAARPNEGMPAVRSASRRVAYGGEDAAPEGAELLTHFLPLDRATLEVAIDRVFGQLAGFSPELPELAGPIEWVSVASTVLAAGIAAELAVRAMNRYRRDDHEADDEGAGAGYVLLPGLPGGWKLEER